MKRTVVVSAMPELPQALRSHRADVAHRVSFLTENSPGFGSFGGAQRRRPTGGCRQLSHSSSLNMPFFFEFSASTGVSSSAEAFLTLANSSARSRCAPAAASDLQLFASASLAVMSGWRVCRPSTAARAGASGGGCRWRPAGASRASSCA